MINPRLSGKVIIKELNKWISLMLVLISIPCLLSSQELVENESNSIRALTLNIGRIFLCEARIGYEKEIAESTILRGVVGLKVPLSNSYDNYSDLFPIGTEPTLITVTSGVYLGIGLKKRFGRKGKSFLTGELYHDFDFYNKKTYEYFTTSVWSYRSLESMMQFKPGFKVLYSYRFQDQANVAQRLAAEFFFGVGIQYRYTRKKLFEKYWEGYSGGELDPPSIDIYDILLPTIHLGLLFYLPIG